MKNEIVMRAVMLKGVLTETGDKDIEVNVVPFSRRNEEHVEFAFEYADMLGGNPSRLKNMSDAAREYVRLFMAHKAEDEANPASVFSCVYKDLRAARTLFFQPETRKEIDDFFTNA